MISDQKFSQFVVSTTSYLDLDYNNKSILEEVQECLTETSFWGILNELGDVLFIHESCGYSPIEGYEHEVINMAKGVSVAKTILRNPQLLLLDPSDEYISSVTWAIIHGYRETSKKEDRIVRVNSTIDRLKDKCRLKVVEPTTALSKTSLMVGRNKILLRVNQTIRTTI